MVKDINLYCEDEFNNGAETVEIVFGIVFAVGIASCLLMFQTTLSGLINQVQTQLSATFSSMLGATK